MKSINVREVRDGNLLVYRGQDGGRDYAIGYELQADDDIPKVHEAVAIAFENAGFHITIKSA